MVIRKLVAIALLAAMPVTEALSAALQAFKPTASTVLVAANTTAQSVTLVGNGGTIRIFNPSGSTARVEISGAAATTPTSTTTGSLGIANGSVELLEFTGLVVTISVKLDAGAGNVEFTRGEGL